MCGVVFFFIIKFLLFMDNLNLWACRNHENNKNYTLTKTNNNLIVEVVDIHLHMNITNHVNSNRIYPQNWYSQNKLTLRKSTLPIWGVTEEKFAFSGQGLSNVFSSINVLLTSVYNPNIACLINEHINFLHADTYG